jgi:hypothetical protein
MSRHGLLAISVALALWGRKADALELPIVPGPTFPLESRDSIADVRLTPEQPTPQKNSPQSEVKGLATDSTADDRKDLREALEKLSKKLTVTVGEDMSLRVFGTIQGSMTFNTARPVAPGTEMYLLPASSFGLSTPTVDVHARASSLGALVTGPKVGEWESRGLVYVYFYNDDLISDNYGILPYQIWGDIKNQDWRFAVGLQKDIFNPLDPNMLTFGLMYGSGNAGNYRGQFRVERYVKPSDDMQWTMQAGLSKPIATLVTNELRISEDNGWPNVEARLVLGLGCLEGEGLEARRTLEMGLSGVVGQVRTADPLLAQRVVAGVWGVGSDARLKISKRLGVQGEVFAGQSLGTYNGGVLQDVNTVTFRGIRSVGGWAEVYYYLVPEKLHSHVGYGIDDPLDRDVAAGQRLRNDTYFANLIWDATKSFRVGIETTWRETAYRAVLNNEGASIQTVVQWSF